MFLDGHDATVFTNPIDTLNIYELDGSFAGPITRAARVFGIAEIPEEHLRLLISKESEERTLISILRAYRDNGNDIEFIKSNFS